jgi:hypothetical protein
MAVMGFKPKFKAADIEKAFAQKVQQIEQVILLNLQRIGEEFVTTARNNGSYKDHTGNLRSSVGYVILKNGEQIDQNFKTFPGVPKKKKTRQPKGKFPEDRGFMRADTSGLRVDPSAPQQHGNQKGGIDTAKQLVDQLKKKFPRGFVLIVVAGMEYAAAVESRGYEVITASGLLAQQDLEKAIERIQEKIRK